MPSTSSKLSSNKGPARSMSQTRLVAAKTAAKPAGKLTPAPKGRTSPPPPPPAASSIGKSKAPRAAAPAQAPVTRPSKPPTPAASAAEERPTKGGQTKNELKAQFAKLSGATAQIAGLKRALNKGF